MAESRRAPPETWIQRTIAVGVLTYLGAVLVVPLLALAWTAARQGGKVVEGLSQPDALHALRMSAILAVIAVVVNGTVGVIGGLVLARQRFFGRRLLDSLVDLPMALSPVMIGLAFIALVGRGGWLAPLLDAAGVSVLFNFPGLVLGTVFVTIPFTVREVVLVLDELGDSEEQAAATLGATPWQTFWRVTLPNLRGALEIGVTLTLARSLGEFGAVLVLGGAISQKTQTATTFIHAAMEERQQAAAYGMALLLAAISIALLAFLRSRRRAHGQES